MIKLTAMMQWLHGCNGVQWTALDWNLMTAMDRNGNMAAMECNGLQWTAMDCSGYMAAMAAMAAIS